jgi:putative redox protein
MIRTRSLPELFRSAVSNGVHEIHTDAPVNKGGEGTGFGAHDLLEAALATCINMAVRMCAAEHAIPLEHVTTRVNLERPDSERVVFNYALELAGPLSSEQRQQLEHVADACPVRQTLSKRLEFHAAP